MLYVQKRDELVAAERNTNNAVVNSLFYKACEFNNSRKKAKNYVHKLKKSPSLYYILNTENSISDVWKKLIIC